MSTVQEQFSKSFFEPIIEKLFKNEVEIKSIDISYVVPPGENYICELLRFVVNFSQNKSTNVESFSLIGKRLLNNETVKQFEKELNLFNCELGIYADILPIFDGLEHKKKICAKMYYLSKGPKKLLLLEDLSVLNYKMANRQEGLNLEHCLLAITKLAYFHAASLLMYEKNPKLIDQYNKGVFAKNKPLEQLFSVTFPETLNVCKKEPSLQKYFVKIKEDFLEKFYTATKRDPNFNVLNHGDFWCNNMMFQYNSDGKLKDVLFIDFQVSVFTSPFFDLHYFLASSTNLDVTKNHIPSILNHYYDVLLKNIKILKVKTSVPNRKDFDKDFCDKAFIGLAVMCSILPAIKASKNKDANLANYLDNGEEGSFRHKCFTNPAYINTLQCLLPFYDSLGVFDK